MVGIDLNGNGGRPVAPAASPQAAPLASPAPARRPEPVRARPSVHDPAGNVRPPAARGRIYELQRGGNIPVFPNNAPVGMASFGFGWNILQPNGPKLELFPAAVMLDANGKSLGHDAFVFFNQLQYGSGAVAYVDDQYKEQIDIDFRRVPAAVDRIVFIVMCDPDRQRPGNFSQVRDAGITMMNSAGTPLARFSIPDGSEAAVESMVFAEAYRRNGQWKFKAIGAGYSHGVAEVFRAYGIER